MGGPYYDILAELGERVADDFADYSNYAVALENIDTVLGIVISGVLSLLLLVVVLFQCVTTCCHRCCYCLLLVQIPLTLVAAIVLLGVGFMLGNSTQLEFEGYNTSRYICEEVGLSSEIKSYYDPYIDDMMCSQYCPCTKAALVEGGYIKENGKILVELENDRELITVEEMERKYSRGYNSYPRDLKEVLTSVGLEDQLVPVANSY